MVLNAMILVFWMLSFKPMFSLSSFTFIKSLFSSSSLSAIRVIIICISEVIDISPSNLDSSLCFIQPSISHDVLWIEVKEAGWWYTALMYSFPSLEPVHCFMSNFSCFLTCIQISQVVHTVKGFGVVSNSANWEITHSNKPAFPRGSDDNDSTIIAGDNDNAVCIVLSNSSWPHQLYSIRVPFLWDFPGNNTGVGCYSLLQGIFRTQGWNLCFLCLLPWQAGSSPLVPPEKPWSGIKSGSPAL